MNISAIGHNAKIASKWFLGLFVALFLLILVINVFDEDLTPESRALLALPVNQVADTGNLYLALMGFNAPSGQSPLVAGQTRLNEYEKSLEEIRKGRDPSEVFPKPSPPTLVCRGKIDFIKALTSPVWRDVDGHRAEVEEMLKNNSELYTRYLSLHELSGYYDKATPSLYQEFGYVPKEIRSLFLADVALRLASRDAGQQKRAMLDLGKDIQIWRRMLLGEGALISPMIAISNLQGDFLLLADMLADQSLDISAISAELDHAVTLFELADWTIGKALAYEFRSTAFVLEQMDRDVIAYTHSPDQAWWRRGLSQFKMLYFKKNATLNLSAKAMLQYIKMADVEPGSMLSVWRETEEWQEKNLGFGLGMVYNPIGKILSGIAAPSFADYAFRGYDTAALQRLVKLGYEIRRQGVSERDIPQFIQKHPEWATHPVSGKFFIWNAQKGEIALEPVAKQQKGRRFSIPVWKPLLAS